MVYLIWPSAVSHGVTKLIADSQEALKNQLISLYFKSIKGTELPSIYCGILPSHFCTAS